MSVLARATIADLLPLERRFAPEYPDIWRVIATCVYLQVRAWPDIDGDDAAATRALELTEVLRREFRGSQPYLAAGRKYEAAQRFSGVVGEFNGRNHDVLARDRGVSTRHMYRVLKRDIAAEVAVRQGRLDLPEAES